MAAYYVQRTFADGVKGGLSLSFAELLRPFIFGNNWRRIRIGINFAVNDYRLTRAMTGFRLNVGVCTGMLGFLHETGNTTNYAGGAPFANNGLWNTAALTYTANSGNPYFASATERGGFVTKVGTTITAQAIGGGGQISVPTTGGSVQRRCPYILEITRGAPPLGAFIHSECAQSAGQMSIACVSSEFLELVEAIGAVTPAAYGLLVQADNTRLPTALDSNGPYDTFNLSYACDNVELEVYELIVMRFN